MRNKIFFYINKKDVIDEQLTSTETEHLVGPDKDKDE